MLVQIHDSTFEGGAIVWGGDVHMARDQSFALIAGPSDQPEVYLADATGAVYRGLGRVGEGPGEYRLPWAVRDTRNSHYVFDQRLLRVTQFNKSTLEVEGTTSVQVSEFAPPAPILYEDGSFLAGGGFAGTGGVLQLVSGTGEAVAVFNEGIEGSDGQLMRPVYATRSGDNAFWIAYADLYRLERWDRDGNLLTVIQRDAERFRPRDAAREGDTFTRVRGIHEDDGGRLWVLLGLRHLIETESRADVGGRVETVSRLIPDPDPNNQTLVIEVIDLRSQIVLASVDIPGWYPLMLSGDELGVFELREGPGLQPVIDVWRLVLSGADS